MATDGTPAGWRLQGYETGGFNSVLPLAQNYLYGAATFVRLTPHRCLLTGRAHLLVACRYTALHVGTDCTGPDFARLKMYAALLWVVFLR
jgi:hypothetical protein